MKDTDQRIKPRGLFYKWRLIKQLKAEKKDVSLIENLRHLMEHVVIIKDVLRVRGIVCFRLQNRLLEQNIMRTETVKIPNDLYHYCARPLETLTQEYFDKYKENHVHRIKPQGFWVSVEEDEEDQTWKSWCEQEEFRIEALKYRYHIKLKEKAKILHLSTTDEIFNFGKDFQGNDQNDFDNFTIKQEINPYIYVYEIRWEEVKKQWDGIIISPYNWKCRLLTETVWYYGWDCASGCIWNIDCIESQSLVSIQEEIPATQAEGILTD